jgi:beta-galactosidase
MLIDRRTFIQTGSACLTSLALERSGLAELPRTPLALGRQVLPLNQNWRFSSLASPKMVERDYDDSGFESVTLPHTNVKLPWHDFDQSSYQFVSVYRRELRLPADLGGRRVFIDFEGAMTASTVWLNGVQVGEYRGGYTPFSFELTKFLDPAGRNVLAVEVDSRELSGVPPFGYEIDFLTFGGIYREVSLRIVPAVHIENIFAKASGVTNGLAALDAVVYLSQLESNADELSLEVALLDKQEVLAHRHMGLPPIHESAEPVAYIVPLKDIAGVEPWDLDTPRLYRVRVRLLSGDTVLDEDVRRIGFRTAFFSERGFELNGRVVKLRGLNRHQTFPYAGGAMPPRVQRKDAQILKETLKCNMVRTSHYPQSPDFLDACDEYGLLVLEEIPGWQHIGDAAWQDLAVDNVRRMVRRDWNRPSIVLWSIRINESRDDHAFYTRTNSLARQLDPTRQTIGVRYFQDSELLEDVFGMNDFKFPLKAPNHKRYLNTEFVGAEWPTRSSDNNAIQREHVLRYARIYNQLNSDAGYAGGLGWCAFDYNTHADFGAGDHVCYMGVMDIFREPKAAAGFFKSQCDPSEEAVLEPAFHFAENDQPGNFGEPTPEVVCSNCDTLKVFIRPLSSAPGDFHPIAELKPAREQFPHLAHPPFFLTLPNGNDDWGDLRLDGYVAGSKVISKTLSGAGAARRFEFFADSNELLANGSDATRVVLRLTDEYGSIQRLAGDPFSLQLFGPARLIGPTLISLTGGTTAVWVRANQHSGPAPQPVRLTATHATLGTQSIGIHLIPAARETV